MTRPKAKATVTEGGVTYTNVEVHLKGSAGSFRSIDQKPALTLNFEKSAPGQSFHGLHKISLNNSLQDPTYLSEKICRELFDAAGVPAPRASHAKVELNGRNMGLYVLTEGFGKQFLKRYFKNTKGNLYDGGFVQDITEPLAVNSGENPRDNSDLRALATAATTESTNRMARLEQVLDMNRFLSYVAMETMLCHWDGYSMNRNNWRLYHDLDSKKMVFMPHGMDQMFGYPDMRMGPGSSIFPRRVQGLVTRSVLSTQEGRRRYLERVGQLYTNVFHVNEIVKRVDELAAIIRPVIAESNPQMARYHENAVNSLKVRIEQRGESVRKQLEEPPTSGPRFETGKPVTLTGWRPKIQQGSPSFDSQRESEGTPVLHIAAPRGISIGSWRTSASMEPGRYRFEGRIKTQEVKPLPNEPGSGAGLRVSGWPVRLEMIGTGEWKSFAYEFRVDNDGTDVEFVCELRAAKGDARFDAGSLRVIRLR